MLSRVAEEVEPPLRAVEQAGELLVEQAVAERIGCCAS
jgi:hypothetical protein